MNEEIHFKDLTSYTKNISPTNLSGVLNIGWERVGDVIKQTPEDIDYLQKFKNIIQGNDSFKAIVEPIRAIPNCPTCGEVRIELNNGRMISDGELWIPDKTGNFYYAAPMIILHNILSHGYQPPEEFISALESVNLDQNFDADEVYREKLKESGWYESEEYARMREAALAGRSKV